MPHGLAGPSGGAGGAGGVGPGFVHRRPPLMGNGAAFAKDATMIRAKMGVAFGVASPDSAIALDVTDQG